MYPPLSLSPSMSRTNRSLGETPQRETPGRRQERGFDRGKRRPTRGRARNIPAPKLVGGGGRGAGTDGGGGGSTTVEHGKTERRNQSCAIQHRPLQESMAPRTPRAFTDRIGLWCSTISRRRKSELADGFSADLPQRKLRNISGGDKNANVFVL